MFRDIELIETLDHCFGRIQLTRMSKDINPTFKARKNLDRARFICDNVSTENLIGMLFDNFDSTHQRFYIYESTDPFSSGFEQRINNQISIFDTSNIPELESLFIDSSGRIRCLAKNNFNYQNVNENGLINGDMQIMSFPFPFEIYFLGLNHCCVRTTKFDLSTRHTRPDGNNILIHGKGIDSPVLADSVIAQLISPLVEQPLERCNLTSGLKYLIQNDKLASISTGYETPQGTGFATFTKYKPENGPAFTAKEWHLDKTLISAKIGKGRWFWIDGDYNSNPREIHYFTIDADNGYVSVDRISDESQEWFVNELVQNNN